MTELWINSWLNYFFFYMCIVVIWNHKLDLSFILFLLILKLLITTSKLPGLSFVFYEFNYLIITNLLIYKSLLFRGNINAHLFQSQLVNESFFYRMFQLFELLRWLNDIFIYNLQILLYFLAKVYIFTFTSYIYLFIFICARK